MAIHKFSGRNLAGLRSKYRPSAPTRSAAFKLPGFPSWLCRWPSQVKYIQGMSLQAKACAPPGRNLR